MPDAVERHEAFVIGAGPGGLGAAAMPGEAADGTDLEPDAVLAATSYRRGLRAAGGHLGVLDERTGRPPHLGGQEHPGAPGSTSSATATR